MHNTVPKLALFKALETRVGNTKIPDHSSVSLLGGSREPGV